ncbi:MAG: hypothetical protein HY872_01340 [Chloroflexi bacterium]|nr:hypothetical protein [Chloroflexota bacterium]
MKKLLLLNLTLALMVACGAATPASTLPPPPDAGPAPTTTAVPPADLTPAQLAAMDALSTALGFPLSQIKVTATEPVDWPDGCLGVPRIGMPCSQAVTPGFRITLEAEGRRYEYHTDATGSRVEAFTLAAVMLTWHREGGIAGFCDDLSVYLDGRASAQSCKTNEAYPKGQLTAEELAQLNTWAAAFGVVATEIKDLAIADAISVTITLNGSGATQPNAANLQAMSAWAQTVYERVKR